MKPKSTMEELHRQIDKAEADLREAEKGGAIVYVSLLQDEVARIVREMRETKQAIAQLNYLERN
jgi:hypothetical protein